MLGIMTDEVEVFRQGGVATEDNVRETCRLANSEEEEMDNSRTRRLGS